MCQINLTSFFQLAPRRSFILPSSTSWASSAFGRVLLSVLPGFVCHAGYAVSLCGCQRPCQGAAGSTGESWLLAVLCQMFPNPLSSCSPHYFRALVSEAQPQHSHELVWAAGSFEGPGLLPDLVGVQEAAPRGDKLLTFLSP